MITKLVVENVKKIKRIELTPEGRFIVVAGENEQGKSSLLDSVMYLLCGKGKIPVRVVRDGERAGFVEAEIDDLKISKVRRNFSVDGKTELIVTNTKGRRLQSPQAMVEQMMGGPAISFDPEEFLRMDKVKQIETLKALSPGLDFSDLDEEYAQVYEDRTETNRAMRALRQRLDSLPPLRPGHPTEKVDVSQLAEKLDEANRHNLNLRNDLARLDFLDVEREHLEQKIQSLQENLERVTKEREVIASEVSGRKAIDVAPLREQAARANEINEQVERFNRRLEMEGELLEREEASQAFTYRLDEIRSERAQRLADANLPVPGLGFSEDGVTLNGLPFDRDHLSSEEALRVSVAIALAYNRKGILLIRNGSLLDRKHRQIVREMAEEAGTMVLFEVVGPDAEASIVITDGEVQE